MKKTSLHPIALLLPVFFMVMLNSCKKTKNEGLNYVPKNITGIFSINALQILDKLKTENIGTDSLFELLKLNEANKQLAHTINPKQPILVFFRNTSSIAEGNQFVSGTVAALSSAGDLETDLKKLYPDKKIEQEKSFSYIEVKSGEITGWNKNIVIYLYNANGTTPGQLEELFNLKKDESLASNKNAEKALDQKTDLSYFINSSNSLSNVPYIGMTKASDLLKDTYAAGTIDFENGEINIKSSQYLNATATDIIKQNPTKNISGEALTHFPGKPDMLFDISFNLKQIVGFLDYAGIKNTADTFLQNLGISIDDVANAFKGEIAVAASSFAMRDEVIPGFNMNTRRPHADYLVSLPVADKAAYDKVVNALAKIGFFVSYNGQLVPKALASEDAVGSYNVNDNAVVIASSKNLADIFLSGKENITYPQALDMKNKTCVFYVDLQSIINGLGAKGKDSATIALAGNTFKDITGNADNLKSNEASSNLTLHLLDKNRNSLAALISFFITANKERKAWENNPASIDDDMNTNIPPPPTITDSIGAH